MGQQQYDLNFCNELLVDNFAGFGGASIGLEKGTNRFVDIAVNHDRTALSLHELNHPHTSHFPEDVFRLDPLKVCGGRPVGLAWFSPDCRHFSKAKGGKPVSRNVRGLAWVARHWAKKVAPRLIFLENVEEFQHWGPCIETWNPGKKEWETVPDPRRKGLTFRAFKAWFERNGYVVDHRVLKACDYGAPTSRQRFFLIARNDGLPIVWPAPTHGPRTSSLVKKKKLKPYRTAAECIDWSLPCPSIFMDRQEARAFKDATGITVRRPLKDNSLRRLAKGVVKFVIENGEPYIVPISNYGTGGDRVHSINEPLRTITAYPKGGAFALCTPFISPYYGPKGGNETRGQSLSDPLATLTTENRHALVMPFISRQFGNSVGSPATDPLGAITAGGGGKSAVVAPLIARQFGTGICHSVDRPLSTITAQGGGGKCQLVAASLIQTGYGERPGQAPRCLDIEKPLGTVVASGTKHALCASFLAKHYTGVTGSSLREPMGTVTGIDHHALVSVGLSPKEIEEGALRVAAFLIKYYGQGIGQALHEPMHTLTTKERLALVTVTIMGHPWLIYDIGMRMLKPHELLIAQGFPRDYQLGSVSSTKAVQLIGNSVPPPWAEALSRANYTALLPWRATA